MVSTKLCFGAHTFDVQIDESCDDNVAKFFIHSLSQITDRKYFVFRVLALENPYFNRKWAKF